MMLVIADVESRGADGEFVTAVLQFVAVLVEGGR
jgi:hypothetical protein